MSTQTIRNGASIVINLQPSETLKVVAVSGTYTLTGRAGSVAGTIIAAGATGGTYGPYAAAVTVSLASSVQSEIDFDSGAAPVIESDTVAMVNTNPLTGGLRVSLGGMPVGPSVPVLDSVTVAAANRAALQKMLDGGGPIEVSVDGEILIDQKLIIDDNTTLTLGLNTTIRQAVGMNDNMIVTRAMVTPWSGVTVSWTSGRELTVNYPSHPHTVGQYVWIDNAVSNVDQSCFKGVFRITSTTTDAFVVAILRTPTAGTAPTGSGWQVKKATTRANIVGGTWDYDREKNSSGAVLPGRHAIYFAGTAHCSVKTRTKNTLKYGFVSCADYRGRYEVEGITTGTVVGSDIVKIYGPSFGTIVSNATGKSGDDCVSFQTKEPAAFAGYQIAWGDILGCKAVDTTVDSPVAQISGVVGYGSPGEMMNLEVDGVHGCINGAATRVQAGDAITNANISSFVVKRVTASARLAVQVGGGAGAMVHVGVVKIENPVHNPLQSLDACIEVKDTATVKSILIDGIDSNVNNVASPSWPASPTAVAVLLAGVIDSVSLRGGAIYGSQSNLRAMQVSSGATVKKINVSDLAAKCERLINISATGAVTPMISIANSRLEMPKVIFAGSSVDATVVGCSVVGATSGIVQQSAGTATLAHGGNVLSGGSVVSSGTVTATPF